MTQPALRRDPRRLPPRLGAALVAAALLAACGESSVEPDPSVAPFVGTWDAVEMTLTGVAPPNTVFDVLAAGTFDVTIEPSGAYTARLVVLGQTRVEFGQLTVNEGAGTLALDPSNPPGPPTTGAYSFEAEDYVTIEGPTEFDVNGDFEPEAATLHLELQRR